MQFLKDMWATSAGKKIIIAFGVLLTLVIVLVVKRKGSKKTFSL